MFDLYAPGCYILHYLSYMVYILMYGSLDTVREDRTTARSNDHQVQLDLLNELINVRSLF